MSFAMRPSPAFRADFEAAYQATGLHAARLRGPVVAMHVRHGDSCGSGEARRTGRRCDPLSAYVAATERLANATRVPITTVFLATDDVRLKRALGTALEAPPTWSV